MEPTFILILIGLLLISIFFFVVSSLYKAARLERHIKNSQSYVYKYTVAIEQGGAVDLQDLYFKNHNTHGSLVKYGANGAYYSTDYFLKLMRDFFDEFKIIKRIKDPQNLQEMLYISCKKGNDVTYFSLSNSFTPLNSMEAVREFSLKDYIILVDEQSGKILKNEEVSKKERVLAMVVVTSVIKMVYPVDREIKDDIIHDMLDKTLCRYKKVEYKTEPIRLFNILKLNGGLVVRGGMRAAYLEPLSKEELDLRYGTVKSLAWKGKLLYQVPMSKVYDVITLGVDSLQNTLIFGPKGCLKTRLIGLLAHSLSRDPNNRVFQLSAASLENFGSVEFQTLLESEFKRPENPGQDPNEEENLQKNIIIIDEAHFLLAKENKKKATALLEAMDGAAKAKYNLCFILVINIGEDKILGDVFRSNRSDLQINLQPLNQTEAIALMESIEKSLDPTKLYMDRDQLFQALGRKNYVDEDLQDDVGYLAQSSIYECVKPINQASVLENILTDLEKSQEVKPPRL